MRGHSTKALLAAATSALAISMFMPTARARALAGSEVGERATASPTAQRAGTSGSTANRRQTSLTLPVVRNESPLGEIGATIAADGSASFEGATLFALMRPLLSELGESKLRDAIGGSEFVAAERLAEAGFNIRFDMSRLQVVVGTIAPELRFVQSLSYDQNLYDGSTPTVEAADFSAYLSLAGNLAYTEGQFGDGVSNPDILAFGAARAGNFALEYEGGLAERGQEGYGPYRRFVRGIYDIEGRAMRISAGDLQVDALPIFGAQQLGGFGIERRRRIFSPFEPAFNLGGRRVQVASPSTIEVVSNGQTIRTISVDEGIYDLEQLPLLSGANNVDIIVRDAAGRTSTTNFDYFYDPVELEAGDYEFGAYVGLISSFASLEPDYGSDIAATGFYRRGLTPSLLVGGAIQVSERSQAIAGEVRWVPQVIPGTFQGQVAASDGTNGVGFAARAGYRWGQSTPIGGRQISFQLDFETAGFEPVSRPFFLNEKRLNLTLNYGQNISRRTYVSSGASYFKRGTTAARKTLFADIVHQFRPRVRGILGLEYGSNDGFGDSFGVRLGVNVLLGRSSRAAATYESRRDLYRATYSKGLEDYVGAVGYDASVQSTDGRSLADAAFRYRGNRFDGRVLVSSGGEGLSGFTDSRRAQLQLSTSLAYADGSFGVGRPITDGFAVVRPHPAIDGKVIVGNRLNNGEYQARSGVLGAAVVPNLLGYQTREVLFDIDASDTIYDVGDGSDKIRVQTGGGAKLTVGDFRFVSAVGTVTSDGEPVALTTGKVTSKTDEGFPEGRFFTNRGGRFSIIGLAPGERYDVELRDGRTFEITVPNGSEGLLRIDEVQLGGTSE